MTIDQAIQAIQQFQGLSLTKSLSMIEADVLGLGDQQMQVFCEARQIDASFMDSAAAIKQVAGQINVIIHAAGILCSLPGILEPGEVVQSVSLGAGNTGRKFDLETNLRIAEYKFIDWRGGSETFRQNSIFKDFFSLAEYETPKRRYLYVVDTTYPIKFFQSRRALNGVVSKMPEIKQKLAQKYGTQLTLVRDYYALKKDEVQLQDISPFIGRG